MRSRFSALSNQCSRVKSQLNMHQRRTIYSTRICKSQSWNKLLNPNLKSPGGKHSLLNQQIGNCLATRIPLCIMLVFMLNDEDYSPIPFTFDYMAGPSMLPTILPVGECYIRLKRWYLSLLGQELKVGDIIVFLDLKGGNACKRIVGLEGDAVDKCGEYVHLYQDEHDLGIRKVPMQFRPWQEELEMKQMMDGKTLVVIPEGCAWVEGDNPLHSVDSRHYGPIPMASIKGRVAYRIWPRRRPEEISYSCGMNPTRPHPLTEDEMFSGAYSIIKIPYSK